MGLMSRNKGKVGEREVCTLLREHLGDIGVFERNSMQAHGEARSGSQVDILTNLPIAPEVKRTEDFQPKKWLEQARSQARGGKLPMVFHRANGQPWRILFELHPQEFFRIMRALALFNSLPKAEQARLLAGNKAPASDLLTHEDSNAVE